MVFMRSEHHSLNGVYEIVVRELLFGAVDIRRDATRARSIPWCALLTPAKASLK